MKVLVITDYFPPEIGGASHLMSDLSVELYHRGNEVSVATGMPRYNMPKTPIEYRHKVRMWESYQGVQVIRTIGFPTYGRIPLVRALSHFFSSLAHLLSGLAAPRPDVTFVLSPPLTDGLAAYILRRMRRGKFILNVQDIFPQNAIDLGIMRNRWVIRVFTAIERFVYRKADAIVVHSEGNRQFLIKRKNVPPEKIFTIPNWVNTDNMSSGAQDNEFRAKHNLNGQFVATFAGVMGWSQGLDSIVEAANHLRDINDVLFLLVGEGVEKPKLQESVKQLGLKNVKFLPMQSREEYAQLLQASDACFVTLHKDVKTPVVPSKILSIMAASRPIVAALPLDGDGARLIKEAECGLCVLVGDSRALAESVRRLSIDPSLARQLGNNGRMVVESQYSLNVCLAKYESLLADLLK
jgi:colanic acid biosynthesis glycosyl transferase WcaI